MTRTINWTNLTCQEVVNRIGTIDVLCGHAASAIIFHQHDGRHLYLMCPACADHAIRNRRAIELEEKRP